MLNEVLVVVAVAVLGFAVGRVRSLARFQGR